MSSRLVPANPAELMVIRNVTPSIVTFSVPFSRFGKIKFGGRGTLVKLSSGALAVFSPVALTSETIRKVAEMGGTLRYIIAMDIEHHIFVSDWARQYPEATLVGPEGLQEKRHKQHDQRIGNEIFNTVFTKVGKRQISISDEFDTDFDYEYVDGHGNLELVFCYRPDKVLIEADLMFNLPAIEQFSRVSEDERRSGGFLDKVFTGLQSPGDNLKWMRRFNWYLMVKDRASYNESLNVIKTWNFDTIIPCHGEVIQGGGKDMFRKVFDWHLAPSQ